MTRYLVYDVFTDRAFGGNPLAVFPDASGLAEDDLQRIAREFNLSETTFVFPPEDPAHTARVRIFTPSYEMPFAGHPTVGTAIALQEMGLVGREMVFEMGVGPIPVRIEGRVATLETRVPLTTRAAPTPARVAALVSLPETAIATHAHAPVNAGVGVEHLLAELTDETQLTAAHPDSGPIREEIASGGLRMGIFIYVRRGAAISARMFAPEAGIPEDPATGGASAVLAAFLGQLDGTSQRFTISQGVAMGRPSTIHAGVTVEAGVPVAVTIGGGAVKIMEGRLTI